MRKAIVWFLLLIRIDFVPFWYLFFLRDELIKIGTQQTDCSAVITYVAMPVYILSKQHLVFNSTILFSAIIKQTQQQELSGMRSFDLFISRPILLRIFGELTHFLEIVSLTSLIDGFYCNSVIGSLYTASMPKLCSINNASLATKYALNQTDLQ